MIVARDNWEFAKLKINEFKIQTYSTYQNGLNMLSS